MYDIILAPFNWLPRWVETNSKQKSYDTFPKAPWVQTGNDSILLVEMYRAGDAYPHKRGSWDTSSNEHMDIDFMLEPIGSPLSH
jgi:hypothetical protein